MTGLYRKILNAIAHTPVLLALAAAPVSGVAAPAWAEGPGTGEVTAVSLAPVAGKAELVIAVKGAVDVRDFILASPDRLVLDVVGARLSDAAPAAYDGMARGGVLNIRYSQFKSDVVRVVIELDGEHPYEVRRSANEVRVSVNGGTSAFEAWHSSAAAATREVAREAEPEPEMRMTPVAQQSQQPPADSPDDPESLAGLITTLNGARHAHPALQSDWSLRFHDTDNDQLIAYSKRAGRTAVLTIVNVDYANMQEGWVRVPLADWGLAPGTPLTLADVVTGETYTWTSEWNYVRLEPDTRPAHVLVIRLP